jgi:hypothetical protein
MRGERFPRANRSPGEREVRARGRQQVEVRSFLPRSYFLVASVGIVFDGDRLGYARGDEGTGETGIISIAHTVFYRKRDAACAPRAVMTAATEG